MGKVTDSGLSGPDHPVYKGEVTLSFAPINSAASSQTSAKPDCHQSGDEDEARAAKLMVVGRAIQNVMLAMYAKGKPLGPMTAVKILEMADSGEIEELPSVQALRRLVAGHR